MDEILLLLPRMIVSGLSGRRPPARKTDQE